MIELKLSSPMAEQLEDVYREMEKAYSRVARMLEFSCSGCSDNCCDSYFKHHTYIEWCYLWRGISELPEPKQQTIVKRAQQYIVEMDSMLGRDERPQIMCPLNDDGLCSVYKYRLMVCRTHGVPAEITRPDGQKLSFPGCFRCQNKVKDISHPPRVERSAMLRQLAALENELLQGRRHLYPRVKLTIAEMLVKGPPKLPPVCG